MALNLIMLGPPGAGKGTQAERIAQSRGIPKISTGDLLREAARLGTDVGVKAKSTMDRGELVGDDVMIGIVRERLERPDVGAGFVLDGFPRTVAQAKALDGLMNGREPLVVVDIAVPEEELVRRLGSRMICEDCGSNADWNDATCRRCGGRLQQRSDDNNAVILERLRVHRQNAQLLTDYYRGRATFRAINGAQKAEQVAADLMKAIDGVLNEGLGR